MLLFKTERVTDCRQTDRQTASVVVANTNAPRLHFKTLIIKRNISPAQKGPIYNSEGNSEALMLFPGVRLSARGGQTARGRSH